MNKTLLHTFAVKHKNDVIRSESRSGGIFTALSDYILENNGSIYGCILDENFDAIHVKATTVEERNKMRGSKYIQSRLGDTFESVKRDLSEDRLVLFSGTSCQTAGLQAFLGKEYENLICVDIVCHGVPSPSIWKDYIKWQEQKYQKKCVSFNFRNKKDFGWEAHRETLIMEDGEIIHSNVFAALFLQDTILRPACSKCPYKEIFHPSDITIADYWGIDKIAPEFNDNKGVSLVLVNTEKGDQLFKKIESNIDFLETHIEDSMQPALVRPSEQPDNRAQIWKELHSKGFDYIEKKYINLSFIYKVKRKIRNIISKFRL